MTKLKPFADDAASTSIGELTVENGTERIALYGSLDLTRDKQGLAQARALEALLDQAVQLLEADKACRTRCRRRSPQGRSRTRSSDI